MGLDMYLTKELYISKYSDKQKSLRDKLADIEELAKYQPVGSIEAEVMYWRKENHIHQWFVDNVQEGTDECQKTYVTRDNLEELVRVCKAVLANHDTASELLPCSSGFFFGGEEYNEYYFKALERTIEAVENEDLEDFECSYYYQSSW